MLCMFACACFNTSYNIYRLYIFTYTHVCEKQFYLYICICHLIYIYNFCLWHHQVANGVRNALGPKDLVDRGAESTIELQRTHCWRPGFFIFIHIPVYAHLKVSQIEYCTHMYIYIHISCNFQIQATTKWITPESGAYFSYGTSFASQSSWSDCTQNAWKTQARTRLSATYGHDCTDMCIDYIYIHIYNNGYIYIQKSNGHLYVMIASLYIYMYIGVYIYIYRII